MVENRLSQQGKVPVTLILRRLEKFEWYGCNIHYTLTTTELSRMFRTKICSNILNFDLFYQLWSYDLTFFQISVCIKMGQNRRKDCTFASHNFGEKCLLLHFPDWRNWSDFDSKRFPLPFWYFHVFLTTSRLKRI